jgi:hypothetical protein
MKYLIACLIAAVLAGCDQTSDISDNIDKDDGIANATGAGEASTAVEAPAGGQTQELKAQVFQFGIYTAEKKGRIGESAETNTGKVVRKPVLEHESMTDRIPLEMDTYFGIQYRLWNLPTEVMTKRVMELRSVLIHPEMTLPDGSTSTGWDRSKKGIVKSRQVLGFEGYAFNEDYELVEGDWIFQVWFQDRLLVERTFVTYWPEEGAGADQEPAGTAAENPV